MDEDTAKYLIEAAEGAAAMLSVPREWSDPHLAWDVAMRYAMQHKPDAPTRAAVNPAREDARVPQGWKLVPVEPTPEILAVMQSCEEGEARYTMREAWRAMLAAAPRAYATAEITDAPVPASERSLLSSGLTLVAEQDHRMGWPK